jgi:hypothetical protein
MVWSLDLLADGWGRMYGHELLLSPVTVSWVFIGGVTQARLYTTMVRPRRDTRARAHFPVASLNGKGTTPPPAHHPQLVVLLFLLYPQRIYINPLNAPRNPLRPFSGAIPSGQHDGDTHDGDSARPVPTNPL